MTTREIYFKILLSTDNRVHQTGYMTKDKFGSHHIHVFSLELGIEQNIVNRSLQRMKYIEEQEGFLFWNTSVEGEHFFEENKEIISKTLREIWKKSE